MAFITDDMIQWPAWLPILIRDDYSYDIKDNSLTVETDMVDVKRNRFSMDAATVSGSAVFTWAELTFFEAFEKHLLNQGASWFLMPIYTAWGTTVHRARIIGRPKMGKMFGEWENAGMWVTLTLDIADRKTLTKSETEFIYQVGLDFVMNRRLHVVMHETFPGMPGSTIIPKEFYGTYIWKDDATFEFIPYTPEDTPEIKGTIIAPYLSGIYNNQTNVDVSPTITIGKFDVYPAGYDTPKLTNNFKYIFSTQAGAVLESGYKTFPSMGGTIKPKEPFIVGSAVSFTGQWIGGIIESKESTIKFTVIDGKVATPSILQPSAGSSGIGLRPTIVVSGFATAGPVDTPESTEIQVSSDIGFTSNVGTYKGGYTTSYAVSSNLTMGKTYYTRVRHKGRLFGWSAWSNTVVFTVMSAALTTPVITNPRNNAEDVAERLTIDFNASATQQTLVYAQVQVATDSGFSSLVWDSGTSFNYTSSVPVGRQLTGGQRYYTRVRVSGSVSGWSSWSSAVSFTVAAVSTGEVWFITSSSVFNPPTDGRYQVEVCGGGGAYIFAAVFGGMGNVGGYAKKTITLSKAIGVPVTIGAYNLTYPMNQADDPLTPADAPSYYTSFGSYVSARCASSYRYILRWTTDEGNSKIKYINGGVGIAVGGDVNVTGTTAASVPPDTRPYAGLPGYFDGQNYGRGGGCTINQKPVAAGAGAVKITYLGR